MRTPLPSVPVSEELPQGFQLGQYVILAKLGQGGMGTVYRALHARLKRTVALKVLSGRRAHEPQTLARFQREMEIVGKLDHPHLVRATDAGETAGHAYLVMDLIDGLDLHHLVTRVGPLPLADACDLIRQAAVGLQYVHAQGLVHRDIKPSNLLLGADGCVRVLDLGISRLYEKGPDSERLTDSGQIMGTADYMAPEQGINSHAVDIRADVYSLGCTLYKLLTGQPPFSGPEYDSYFKKLFAHVQTPVPPVGEVRPEVPDGLAAVLGRMLAKAPADRFATPGEVAEALRPFASGADPAALLARVRLGEVEQTEPDLRTRADAAFAVARHEAEVPVPFLSEVRTPTRHPDRKRPRLLLTTAALAVAALAWLLSCSGWFDPASAPSGTEHPARPEEAKDPTKFRPRVWHGLLTNRPAPLLWPEPALQSNWTYEEGRQSLTVNCHEIGLLQLGTAPGPEYVLQLGIDQWGRWHGGVGCFLGFRETEEAGEKFIRYQRIELMPYRVGDPKQAFKMCRILARVKVAGRRHWAVKTHTVAQQVLAQPPAREQILEVTVEKRGLTRVRWGTSELGELVTPQVNALVGPENYHGPFGAFNNSSAGVFHNARLLRLEGD